MEFYIATIFVKPGFEDQVAAYHKSMQDEMSGVPGFIGREVYQADNGRLMDEAKKIYTEEEIKQNAEDHHTPSTHFVMIEKWESADARMKFVKSVASEKKHEIIPYLLPDHTHEFYSQIAKS